MFKKLFKRLTKIVSLLWESEEIKPDAQSDYDKFEELNWSFGGFNGQEAIKCEDTIIADLKVKSNGLSYRWVAGGCENLGASDRTDASATLACLFCLIGGKWQGGKFDWISTSRTTRDFHNIATGYHGWDSCAIDKAEAYRFVIVSKDGRRRTNVIEVAR